MFEEELVLGYPAFETRIKDLENDNKIRNLFILFQANETETRQALCPHCNAFETTLQGMLNRFPPQGFLLRVSVGYREEFHNEEPGFPRDPRLQIQSLPTLLNWRSGERLSGDDIMELGRLVTFFAARPHNGQSSEPAQSTSRKPKFDFNRY